MRERNVDTLDSCVLLPRIEASVLPAPSATRNET